MTSDVDPMRGSKARPSPSTRAARSIDGFAHLLAATAGGTLASFGATAIDAHFAWRAAAGGAGSRLSLLLAEAGIVAPFGVAIGAAVGTSSLVFWPPACRNANTIVRWLNGGSREERIARSAAVAVSVFFGFLAVVGLSYSARDALGASVSARTTGALLAVRAMVFLLGLAAASSLTFDLAKRHAPVWIPSPVRSLILVTTLVVVFAAIGVESGSTNGDGGFLGILGVLRREELDLRGVALGLGIAIGAFLLPGIQGPRPIKGLLLIIVGPLGLTAFAAGPGLEARPVALAIERGAPLGSVALTVLRRLTDRDHDGVSARFGGGDCDDHDARVFPGADDIPGNGIDEDCSGADDVAAPPAARPPSPSSRDGNVWVREHFPNGLNVVLITIDTLRSDLGFAGNPRPVSPHIDALARRSRVFDHAYSLASYTGKSMGPMLIGKYPSETVRTFDHFDRFGPEETFVQERLRSAGVRTLTAQGHWYFEPPTGLGRGFDDADWSAAPRVPQAEGDRTVNGDVLTDRALALLDKPENVAHRFYLWLHYVDPHAAYVPHPEFDFGTKSRDLYDGEVAFVDQQVGRLVDRILGSSFASRTAIVLTSDHGEAFGEHGLIRHGHEVWEELVHVPLIVYVPGVPPGHVGVRRSAIDITPTLLDLGNAPKPAGSGRDFVSGSSLVPDVVAATDSHPTPRAVLVDMSEGPYNDERQAYFDGPLKLIATNGRPLGLYDLDRDPGEKHDLLGESARAAPIVAKFRAYRRTLRTVPATR